MKATDQPLVMLIDDNDIDLFLNRKFLRVADVTDNVLSFQAAAQALDFLQDHADDRSRLPSYILLDIQMPEVDGFKFLELYEALPDSVKEHTEVFMLSSSVDPGDIARASENPYVVKILQKPLDPAELKVVLRRVA